MNEANTKRIIARLGQNLYFTGSGWTESIDEALSFSNLKEVLEACQKHHLVEVELMVIDESTNSFRIPLA